MLLAFSYHSTRSAGKSTPVGADGVLPELSFPSSIRVHGIIKAAEDL